MADYIFSFFLSLILISSTNHVKSNEEGYITVDISNKGLDFAKEFLVQMAESSLVPLDLPKIEKSKHIPIIGTVHMGLSNITVDKIHVISSTVKAGDTGIVISVSGATANMTMNWEYSYTNWWLPIPITDNGEASIQVEGMDVGISFNLTNNQGSLMLSPLDCGCSVKDISIKLDGGASWLYQGLLDAFEVRLTSAVENAISKKLKEGIVKLDSLLQSLPKEIPIRNIAALNVTFVGNPQLRDTSLTLSINGLISAKDAYSAFSYHHLEHLLASLEHLLASVPVRDPASMVTISLHEKVLVSASSVYYDANKMHWIVDKVPEQSLLNTAEWRFIIPQLYRQYPNADMTLNVTIFSPPNLKIKEHQIDVTVHADVVINVLNSGEVTPVACFSTAVSGSASAWFTNNNLAGSIGLDEFFLSLKWSRIGNLHVNLVRVLMSTALRTVILPYINLKLSRGYSLPTFHGYMLQNAKILCSDSWIKICSDVGPVKQLSIS
ncbi:putative BPI/LBP family protein At1g04970 isoform X1 [Nicotiana tomentosiformis]|uniref:putative BPI/LBP family protein At1g04970 isoform X1 n=2 Tax=Nicotiana tomentosiformis TaxID=4098 RepID=UPI00051B1448|nr:putative BPI/LBP family protein At1g04970 [Nicotiana tomentosiformis]